MDIEATDAHCHIGGISSDIDAAVCAINEAQWPQLARAGNPKIKKVYGLFLGEALSHSDAQLSEAFKTLRDYLCGASAVGEFGLDKRFTSVLPFYRQEKIFDAHIELCIAAGLPGVLHCVGAWGFLLKKLKAASRSGAGPFLLHSAGCAAELARHFMELGCYFSFSARQLASRKGLETAAIVDRDRILLESDDLPSAQAYAQNLNKLAAVRNTDAGELSICINRNFHRFFK